MPVERRYVDDSCEILFVGRRATIFDRKRNKYYQAPAERLPREIVLGAEVGRSRLTAVTFSAFLTVFGIFLSVNVVAAIAVPEGSFQPKILLLLIPYLVVSIVVHEVAHVIALRAMGRSVDGIGFKLNYWIFPAFYIRMNQSLLLSRREKVVVHSSGLLVNLVVNGILLVVNWFVWHSAGVALVLLLVAGMLTSNAVPALKSDGYRILLALAGVDDIRGIRRNVWWVIVIKVGSICYAVGLFIFGVYQIIEKWV